MADEPRFAAFDLATVDAQRARQGKSYAEFLRTPSMNCGIYHLKAGSDDVQSPHHEDELYYIQSGVAKFSAGDKDVDVKPGSLLYVKAREKHKFHAIEEDLTVLVFFATTRSDDELKRDE